MEKMIKEVLKKLSDNFELIGSHCLLLAFSLVLLNSCQINKICRNNISEYTTLNYEIIEKNPIDTIENEVLYRATVLILDSRADNLNNIQFHPDSIICYSLSICDEESLVRANFITAPEGSDLLKKYNLDHFSFSYIKNSDQYEVLRRSIFGSFYIEDIDSKWRKNLDSRHFSSVALRIYRNPKRRSTVLKFDH